MGRSTSSTRAYRVAVPLETQALNKSPDYRDGFEVSISRTDTRTPEQWWRAVFESAPLPVRWFLLLGWRWILGLRLGPLSQSNTVLGWWIVSRETDMVRIELRSALMTAQLILHLTSSTAALTTHVYYTRYLARPLWTAVSLIHRRIIPYLLGRAASL